MALSGKPVAFNPATHAFEPLTNITGISNLYFVAAATTANLTATYSGGAKTLTNSGANAALSIDSYSVSASDKILVKNQSTGSQNGLYVVTTVGDGSTPWVLTRSTDMDTGDEAEERDWFWVSGGSTNADNGFTLTTTGEITLDTTTLTFSRTLGSATGSGQPASAALTDWDDVGVVSAADRFPYSTGAGVWTYGTITAAGRAIIDDADASAQRTTLGLGTAAVEAASAFQTADAELTAIAGLTSAADRLPYFTGSGTASLATFTAAGRALVDDADASAQRTTLGLGTAATSATGDFQASDAELTAIAGLTSAADRLPYFTGSGTASLATFTAAGRALIDDADASAQRTTLGLGTAATSATGDFLPAYAADSWPTENWSDPQALPSGWTVDVTGGAPDTADTYIPAGSGYAIQLVSDADGKAMISKTFAGMTTSATLWQARMEWKIANTNTAGTDVPLTIRDGTRRLIIYPSSAGLRVEAGAAGDHGLTNGDWATITVTRIYEGIYIECGPHLVFGLTYASLTSDATSQGEIRLGNSTTAARTTTIRSFRLNIGAINSAPASHTFKGTYSGRLNAP